MSHLLTIPQTCHEVTARIEDQSTIMAFMAMEDDYSDRDRLEYWADAAQESGRVLHLVRMGLGTGFFAITVYDDGVFGGIEEMRGGSRYDAIEVWRSDVQG